MLSTAVFGGLAVRAAILLRIPGTLGLTLHADGFEVMGLFRRGAAKATGALPINDPLSDDDLAWLMSEWRERALAQPRHTSVPHVTQRA